jgi:hypothetical protein
LEDFDCRHRLSHIPRVIGAGMQATSSGTGGIACNEVGGQGIAVLV